MLKKSLFSPAQPRCAKTHLSPGSVHASFSPSTYRSVRLASSLAAALLGTRRVSARLGGAGEKSDFFSILLGTGRRRQTHFDARVVLIDVFVEVGFDDAVVVDAESLTEGILRDLEPAIDVSS